MISRREIDIDTIIVRANNRSDCAHGCRYCPIHRKRSMIDRGRYADFVHRVREWLERNSSRAQLYHALGYHDDYDQEDLDLLRGLNGATAVDGITLGGLTPREEPELRDWLQMLRSYGLKTVHATFAGVDSVHDHWNGRTGNFSFLMRTLKMAGEANLDLGQRILVSTSTIPSLDRLLDQLEALPPHPGDWRYAMPFFYQTRRQKHQTEVEADRIDERARDVLPARVRALFCSTDEPENLSEREWIRLTRDRTDPVSRVALVVRLTAQNMDALERLTVDEIIADLETRTRQAYESIPPFSELRERYGSSSGTLIYAIARCLEMKWLDRYRDENPEVVFDQSLTHLWFGA